MPRANLHPIPLQAPNSEAMEAEHSLEQVLRSERRQVPWERVVVLLLLTAGATESIT